MHVTCKNCNTTYILDSDLVKETGTKVRCSACRHVFVVHAEDRSRVGSSAPDRSANKKAIGSKASNFNQVSDDDLSYWKEKESRIRNHRIDFENFFDDDKCPQIAISAELQPEVNQVLDTPEDDVPDNDKYKETHGVDDCREPSPKDEEGEYPETDTGFEEWDTLYGSGNFEVHNEYPDKHLLGENPDIPCVPTLDEDFDSSLYAFEAGSQDEPGRSKWEEFDFEPDEFDGEIQAPNLDKVDTDKDVTVENRARQMALEIAEDYGWNHEQTEMLADVFKNHGWSLTRNRIINELKQGMKFYEFQFAVELREIWQSHTEYSIGYVTRESYGDNSLKYRSIYKNPDWSFCLKIIRRFDSIPDPEEMERHLDSLYNIWKSSPAIQSRHNTFYGFIRDAVDAGDNFSEMQAWQFLH
jgi:predicted Zn finger-like uncharacterized protein